MKVNLVKFSNGKWGIRKGGFWSKNHQYLDFTCGLWWQKKKKKNDRFFCDCETDEETAKEIFKQMVIKDTVKG